MTVSYHEDEAQFTVGSPKLHNQRLTIQHWQLRDLLACPDKENEIYLVNQFSVNRYNTITKLSTPVLKYLTYAPTSMTINYGYLAVGGQRAQLTVRHLESNWSVYTTVGGSINNSLTIFDHNNNKRLLVSNNDETIKVFSLPDFRKVDTIEFPTPVNYASVSPDGTKMVAVGDSNQVFLYGIQNDTFQLMAINTATADSGFSCSWNQSSDKYAVASQDGYVSVWDIRHSEKIAKFATEQQAATRRAARCVKFSPSGSIDLMVYSEHVSYINVVDARTFNTRQVIRAAPSGHDQNISGVAFSPSAKSIFVGLESNVLEYKVDTTTRRCFGAGTII
ncbi:WD40 repeat-like protein [Conidiobolus coronatus NRRL 28638]|uniref:WD40 repeat-like protein n=1 Tax=Conidiobolus coronatus (strain ATCC 28846 / CBS 209.66 / NRRL 28638) TaxID=796925 RepID=A0A137P376_CONC2|nr:WD40 repeat-like protein [Conidiobolus coronatus NRRL 28638]|eukprot:KXN69371.1 WD40 repeat-like protein [Conidiobolus coronatus NRRL 28638]